MDENIIRKAFGTNAALLIFGALELRKAILAAREAFEAVGVVGYDTPVMGCAFSSTSRKSTRLNSATVRQTSHS